jgi:hypothetical protein
MSEEPYAPDPGLGGVPFVTIDDIRNAPDTPIPADYDDGRDPAIPLDYDPDRETT